MKQCKNCGKPIRNNLAFCSSACIREYRNKKESKSDSEMNMESDTPFTDYAKKNSPKKEPEKQEQKQVKNNEFGDNPDFQILLSGDGMNRRDHNIDVIKNYVIAGLGFNDIWRRVRRKLTSRRLEEYYNIVLDEIKGER